MPKAIPDQIVDRDAVVAKMKDVIRSRGEADAGHLDDALVALTPAETAAIIGVRLELSRDGEAKAEDRFSGDQALASGTPARRSRHGWPAVTSKQ